MGAGGEPAVFVTRGGMVESVHRAIIAVCDTRGEIVAKLGDPSFVTFLRSSAKPFQALPLVAGGAAEAFDLSDRELAVIIGSHGGEDRHTKAVEGILAKAGLGPESLKCGVHKPYHAPTAARLGEQATALHHNCSGKHAGMLLLARHLGQDPATYLDRKGKAQTAILRAMADVAGLPPGKVLVGTDGCSAPNFAMPVRQAAMAFARLGAPGESPAHPGALRRIRDAMRAEPGMVAGEGRFDTVLMEAFGGRVLSKSGAEGFEGLAVPSKALGVGLKIEDGSSRAVAPAAVEALRQMRAAKAKDLQALEPHLGRVQRNWAGLDVGGIEARFRLRPSSRSARTRP